MRKLPLHLLFLFFTSFFLKGSMAFAQKQAKIDSLQAVLKTAKEDTNKVNIFNALAVELSSISSDSSIVLAKQALQLAERIKWQLGIGRSHFVIGEFYKIKNDYAPALEHYSKAIEIFDNLEKSGIDSKQQVLSVKSKTYFEIGNIYELQSDYSKSLDNFFKSLKMSEALGDKKEVASVLCQIGNIYYEQNDTIKQLDYCLKALKIAEEIGDKNGTANYLLGVGFAYFNMANFPKALDYYYKSLKMAEELKWKAEIATNLGNIGAVYQGQGDSAIAKGNKTFAFEDRYPKALDYYSKSLKLFKELGDKFYTEIYFSLIGEIYMTQNKLKEAEKFMQDALTLAKEINHLLGIRDDYEDLSKLYSKKGDYKEAYDYYKKYVTAKDSLNNEEKAKKQTRLEMNYEFEKTQAADSAKHEKEMAVATVENKKQKLFRNVSIGGFSVMLLFAGVFFTQRNRISKGKKRSDELLLNILPSETAEELKATGTAKAKSYDMVTVLFTDFKNFTQVSEKLSAQELVNEIHYYYSEFDKIISKHGIEKIKTIGDSYMCAGGLPVENKTNPVEVVTAALEIQQFIAREKKEREKNNKPFFEIRLGINTGPVVAGIIGIKKFAYDIWGDTVNIASRMESSGEVGKVNISGSTYELVKDKFTCTHRGKIDAKNKGLIDMYFVEWLIAQL